MKRSHLIVLGALLLAPAVAAAQPGYQGGGYYTQPTTVEGGFHDRAGRLMLGFSLGLGFMEANDQAIACIDCDYDPIAGEFDFHIGGMLSHRMGLMFELQGNAQTVADNAYYVDTLVQVAAMGALQYWVTPQLWLKGGLGFTSLSVSRDDGYYQDSSQAEGGFGLLGGIGYELLSARNFAIDLQGRLITAGYDGIDANITSGTIGVGFNWY